MFNKEHLIQLREDLDHHNQKCAYLKHTTEVLDKSIQNILLGRHQMWNIAISDTEYENNSKKYDKIDFLIERQYILESYKKQYTDKCDKSGFTTIKN